MDAIAVVISSSVTGKISSSFDISVMYLFSDKTYQKGIP
jgi:hypothetical protein